LVVASRGIEGRPVEGRIIENKMIGESLVLEFCGRGAGQYFRGGKYE